MSETKRCPKCKTERPMSGWRRRSNGRFHGECNACQAAKTTAFLAAGKLTPRDVFAAFRSLKPKAIQHLIERGNERACGTCFRWKPKDTFRKLYKCGKFVGLAWVCRDCRVSSVREYAAKDPERYRGYQATSRANLRNKRAVGALVLGRGNGRGKGTQDLDVLRRALVERPEELSSEDARAAYFRGFVAGAKRVGYESERFEKLKDLCHRIASEMSRWGKAGHFQEYEDNLGVAYEGLLAFIRKRKTYESDEHERKTAAMAIRSAITDYARTEGPFRRDASNSPRYEQALIPVDESGEMVSPPASPDEPWRDGGLKDSLDQLDLDPRSRAILEGLAAGVTYRELGERFGISESRACGIAREIREKHGEQLLAALAT